MTDSKSVICWHCHNAVVDLDGDPGDALVCGYCAAVSIYDKTGKDLKQPTKEQIDSLSPEDLSRIQQIRHEVLYSAGTVH